MSVMIPGVIASSVEVEAIPTVEGIITEGSAVATESLGGTFAPPVFNGSLVEASSLGIDLISAIPTKFIVTSDGTDELNIQFSGAGSSALVNWGDGDIETITGTTTHTYTTPGSYNGTVTRQISGNRDLRLWGSALTSVSHIQDGLWSLRLSATTDSSINLASVPNSIPSTIANLEYCFYGCTSLNDDSITNWNVSNITRTDWMFGLSSFNQDISSWDVSNVNFMTAMFANNTEFNQNLSGWCVSNFVSEPANFSTGTTAWVLPKPVWGTCPGG